MAQHTINSPLKVDGSERDPITVQILQGEVHYLDHKGKSKKLKAGDPAKAFNHACELVPVNVASVYLT